MDQKGKEQLVHDPSSISEVPRSFERPDSSKGGHPSILGPNQSKESDFAKFPDERFSQSAGAAENGNDRKCLVPRGKTDTEVIREEATELCASAQREKNDSSIRGTFGRDHEDGLGNHHQPKGIASAVMTPFEQSMLEENGWSGKGFANDIPSVSLPTNFVMNEAGLQRTDDATSHAQNPADCNALGKLYSDKKLQSFPFKDQWKPVSGIGGQHYPAMPIKDSNVIVKNVSQGK